MKQNIDWPSDIIAYEAEPRYPRVRFHDASEGTLRVLRHRVRLIEDDDFVWWTWVGFTIGGHGLSTRCLTSKVFDLVPNN